MPAVGWRRIVCVRRFLAEAPEEDLATVSQPPPRVRAFRKSIELGYDTVL